MNDKDADGGEDNEGSSGEDDDMGQPEDEDGERSKGKKKRKQGRREVIAARRTEEARYHGEKRKEGSEPSQVDANGQVFSPFA